MKSFLILFLLVAVSCTSVNPTLRDKNETPAPNSPAASYHSDIEARGIDFAKPLTRITFGSCFDQDQAAPLWTDILNSQSDLFLFMGDNVYASSLQQKPIAEQYRKLDQNVEYRRLREQVPTLATWDDHDFGERDGGADWGGKEAAKRDFLNYWAYARNSLPLEQPGIYHSKIMGPSRKKVQVIMLDTRFNRDPLLSADEASRKAAKNYLPNNQGTLLGEAQWTWLESELKRPADLRFIVTSIQLIANDPVFEKWGNFPRERERFFELLKKTRARNVILLSGDRHTGSVSKMDVQNWGTLYEITASSINRPHNFPDMDSRYVGPAFNGVNFGMAKIDWKQKVVQVELRTLGGQVVKEQSISFR